MMRRGAAVLLLPLVLAGCGERMVEEAVKVAMWVSEKAFGDEVQEVSHITTALATGVAVLSATDLVLGETVQGTIDEADPELPGGHHFDSWIFEVPTIADVAVELSSTDFDSFVSLYRGRPGMMVEELASNDDILYGVITNSRVIPRLEPGIYTVVARGYAEGARGAYTLDVDVAGPRSVHRVLHAGETVDGELTASDATHFRDGSSSHEWYFTGEAGDLVTFTLSSNDFDTHLVVERRGVNLRVNNDFDGTNSQVVMTLPQNGTYSVHATTFTSGDVGAYSLSAASTGSVPEFPDFGSGGDPNGRYAVLVGIDHSPGTNDLAGPIEDARAMERMLVDRFGFQPQNVVTLLNDDATRRNVARGIEQHLGQAGPDGMAVFFYSGHGAQVGSNIGLTGPVDPEPRGNGDEALVLYGYDNFSSYLLDEELGYLIEMLDAERKLVVVDACHSGEITRSPGGEKQVDGSSPSFTDSLFISSAFITSELAAFRVGDTADEERDWSAVAAALDAPRTHIQWGAATEDQYSYVRWDRDLSAFTEALTRHLTASNGSETLFEIHTAVHDDVEAYVAENGRNQNPQLLGTYQQFGTVDAFFSRR